MLITAAGRKKRDVLDKMYGEEEEQNMYLDYRMDANEVVRRIKRQGKYCTFISS